jgi:hypothetical protein
MILELEFDVLKTGDSSWHSNEVVVIFLPSLACSLRIASNTAFLPLTLPSFTAFLAADVADSIASWTGFPRVNFANPYGIRNQARQNRLFLGLIGTYISLG